MIKAAGYGRVRTWDWIWRNCSRFRYTGPSTSNSAGRILGGTDESGSMQLIEISPDGTSQPLTALPGACSGRYLAAERTVVVSHDDGGNERRQLSLLRLPVPGGQPAWPDLEPLVHDPRYIHALADTSAGRICYLTNRRDGVRFDAVLRDLATGAEETALCQRRQHLRGGAVAGWPLARGERAVPGGELGPDPAGRPHPAAGRRAGCAR